MSDIFWWFYEKGSRYKASQHPKALPKEGGRSEAPSSAPLGPNVSKKDAPPSPGRKALGRRAGQALKGPPAGTLPPSKKEPGLLPRKGWNAAWKRACCREQAKMEKGGRSVGHEKKPGRSSSTLKAAAPDKAQGGPLHAKGPQAEGGTERGVPLHPNGHYRTWPRRTKKPLLRQPSFHGQEGQCLLKGNVLAVAHGSMEIRTKSSHRFAISELFDLASEDHGASIMAMRAQGPGFSGADLKPGDLVEVFRFGYQHWAIYVGNGYVIHLAPPTEYAGAGCASLMSTLSDKALVKKELLRDVVGNNQFRVNNKHDGKYDPLPANKIVQRAEERVGQELEYKVTSENCEHFVNELRYGVARSDQVRDVLVGVGVAGLGFAALGLIGAAMVKKKKNQQNQ